MHTEAGVAVIDNYNYQVKVLGNVNTDDGVLFSHKEEQNHVICRQINGIRDLHAKQNKSDSKDKHHISVTCEI